MITVENLSKWYGVLPAIQEVSFAVEQGEIMGFLGPNGAGKTTTLRILTGFMPATSGRASVAGFDVFSQSLEVRRRIGYLPEDVPLYHDMDVTAFLHFVADVKGVARSQKSQQIEAAVERCGIGEVRQRLIGNLSKGFRQRVGLAQALLNEPDVLILDEPTTGLDPAQIIEIRELIKTLAREKTIILSTHILPEVSMICQRVIIINKGRIAAVDTTDNLTDRMQKSTQVLIEVDGPAEQVRAALADVPGVTGAELVEPVHDSIGRYRIDSAKDQDVRRQLAAAVAAHGWGLLELRAVEMSLEDVFVQLVTREEEHAL
jgi:ABC-2 type transport system ATP-binding protein